MKLGAENISILVMNLFSQITHVHRHFHDFGIKIPAILSLNWTIFDAFPSQFGSVHCSQTYSIAHYVFPGEIVQECVFG